MAAHAEQPLQSLYAAQLNRDIQNQLQHNPDINPETWPHAHRVFYVNPTTTTTTTTTNNSPSDDDDLLDSVLDEMADADLDID